MRRVALGEVFDGINLGFTDQLRDVLGIPKNQEDIPDSDKAGKDRLGSTNLIESFGVSQIALVLCFLLLFSLALPIFCMSRKLKCCVKFKQIISSKLNLNFVIAYTYFSWIKITYGTANGCRSLFTDGDFSL